MEVSSWLFPSISHHSSPLSSYLLLFKLTNIGYKQFVHLVIFVLLAIFQAGSKASPFPTLPSGVDNGVLPGVLPVNGSIHDAISIEATDITPWLLCLNQPNSIDCYNKGYINCTDDWDVQSRNQVCVETCKCVNYGTAFGYAPNASAHDFVLCLNRPRFTASDVDDVDEMMESLENWHKDTNTNSIIEYDILLSHGTMYNDNTRPDSTCTLTCISNHMSATCSRCPMLAKCTITLTVNSNLHDTYATRCSCSATGGSNKHNIDGYSEDPFQNLD